MEKRKPLILGNRDGENVLLPPQQFSNNEKILVTGEKGSGRSWIANAIASQSFHSEGRTWIIIQDCFSHIGNWVPNVDSYKELEELGLLPRGIPIERITVALPNLIFKDYALEKRHEFFITDPYKIPKRLFSSHKQHDWLKNTFPDAFTDDDHSIVLKKLMQSLDDGKPRWIVFLNNAKIKPTISSLIKEIAEFLRERTDTKIGILFDCDGDYSYPQPGLYPQPRLIPEMSDLLFRNDDNLWTIFTRIRSGDEFFNEKLFTCVIQCHRIPEPGFNAEIYIDKDERWYTNVKLVPPQMIVEGVNVEDVERKFKKFTGILDDLGIPEQERIYQ